MTDWWSNDPIASAPQAPSAPAGNWWDADKVVMPAPAKAPAVDPIKAQVRAELAAEEAAGRGQKVGPAREFIQGATLGTADEILAAAMTIPNMLKRGTLNPLTAYAYAKAKEDALLEDERKASGALGTVAEIAGGGGLGAGLYRAGATLAPAVTSRLGTGLLGTTAGAAADGVALGALAGAAEGEGAGRIGGAVTGALTGGALGAGIPLAGAALGAAAAPVVSNISARMNPAAYAERQIGKVAADMRLTPDEVATRLSQAAADGQTEYRLMDALGNAGRRKAATVAKNPGEGRETLTEFLDARQAGQGGRVANALEEGFKAPETAQATRLRMEGERRAMDNRAFSDVRSDADPVNVTPALMRIDDTLRPSRAAGLNLENGIAYDSVEGALARARAILSDGRSQVTDFSVVQRARGDIADAVEKAHRAGEGNKARLLRQVRGELDEALENASPGFRDAMAASRTAARNIEAIETGTTAATRGRTEDKLAAFADMRPRARRAFRAGYADPLIERAQKAAMNADAARPLTSLAARTEIPAFASPGRGQQMVRRLGRESEMFQTRAKATGGSTTSENLADDASTGIDIGILSQLARGRFVGATGSALRQTAAGLTGNTEAVRVQLAKQLLKGDPQEVRKLLTQLAAQSARKNDIGATALRSLLGGAVPSIERGLSPNSQPVR